MTGFHFSGRAVSARSRQRLVQGNPVPCWYDGVWHFAFPGREPEGELPPCPALQIMDTARDRPFPPMTWASFTLERIESLQARLQMQKHRP